MAKGNYLVYGCALKKSLTVKTVLFHFFKLEKGQARSENKDMIITCSVKLLNICMYLKWHCSVSKFWLAWV